MTDSSMPHEFTSPTTFTCMGPEQTPSNGTIDVKTVEPQAVVVSKPPRRPLSAYNIFMKFERARMLVATPVPSVTSPSLDCSQKQKIILSVMNDHPFQVDRQTRRHRKTHGSFTFKDLVKQVSTSWKNTDKDTKAAFEDLAEQGRQRYRKEKQDYRIRARRAKQEAARTSLPLDTFPSASSASLETFQIPTTRAEPVRNQKTKKALLEQALELAALGKENNLYKNAIRPLPPIKEDAGDRIWGKLATVRPETEATLYNNSIRLLPPMKKDTGAWIVDLDASKCVSDKELTDFLSQLDWRRL